MNSKVNLENLGAKAVYVKAVAVEELPEAVREQAGDLTTIFAVHNAMGEQLALVANRAMAFELALKNDMRPHTVH
jgi:hypothetical protein